MPLGSLTLIGARDFFVRWVCPGYRHEQHIALFYDVRVDVGQAREIGSFDGQDSDGFSWVPVPALSPDHSSPLVLRYTLETEGNE